LGGPAPNLAAKNIKISARFRTTLWLDREYLRKATRHRQSENGFANYGHSCTGKLNSIYFGPQTAKNRTLVLTHPTGGHQAGHCYASSCNSKVLIKNIPSWADCIDLRQWNSSVPSGQWYWRSHLCDRSMHVPSSHVNSSSVHRRVGGLVGAARNTDQRLSS